MTREQDEICALIAEQAYVSLAAENDVDSPDVKIVKISDEVRIALKHTDRGNDPLSIINKTGNLIANFVSFSLSTVCESLFFCHVVLNYVFSMPFL